MDPGLVPVWIAILAILGLFVAVGAGILTWLTGHDTPAALLAGGAAFGGWLALALLLVQTLRG